MVSWKKTFLVLVVGRAVAMAGNITWRANPLREGQGAGDMLRPASPEMIDNKFKMPGNMTDKQAKEWVKKMEHELFEKPLSRDEYIQRNWMWLRCRSHHSPKFDVGGTWPGHMGENVEKLVKQKCNVLKFRFKYVNGLDWGDAVMDMFPLARCTLRETVWILKDIAKRYEAKYHRNLYLWDCPYFEEERYYGTERDGLAWPGPMMVPNQPLEKPENRPGSWPNGNPRNGLLG